MKKPKRHAAGSPPEPALPARTAASSSRPGRRRHRRPLLKDDGAAARAQFLNYAYSAPQLLRWIPIPRHRMPAFDARTGLVSNSYATLVEAELSRPGRATLWLLRTFRLAKVLPPDESGVTRVSNLTLINLSLYWMGPCREDVLCTRMLAFQALCAAATFAVRFGLAGLFYSVVR